MAKRKRYSAELKARAVLELLREEKPLTKVTSEYEVHPNQLRRWKETALEKLPISGALAMPTRTAGELTRYLFSGGSSYGEPPNRSVPGMFDSQEVQVLYPARWRRRVSETQGRYREVSSEGSVERSRVNSGAI